MMTLIQYALFKKRKKLSILEVIDLDVNNQFMHVLNLCKLGLVQML